MLQLLVVGLPDDTARIRDALEPLQCADDSRFVASPEAGIDALHERLWDAIVWAPPAGGTASLAFMEMVVDLAHGAPVIVVVGPIGEDAAAQWVRAGAADVVSYARLMRLPDALGRELHTKSRIAVHQQRSRTAYAWFASIINHISVGIVYHNERGEIVLCNGTALELLGLTEDEFLGVTSMDPRWNVIRDNGEPFPGSEHPSSEAARTKSPVRGVVMGVFRPRTNDRVWLKVDAVPVFDAEKRLAHIVVKFADFTEQRRLRDNLRESEERFRTAFEHSGTAMLLTTLDLRVLQANVMAGRLFGRTTEDLTGRTMQELTHPDDLALSRGILDQVSSSKQHSVAFEKRYVQPSGRVVWGLVTSDVIPDQHGTPQRRIAVIQDITARKDAEAERNRLQVQLLQAQKLEALGILAGGVAHDFNNILAAILCSADVLLNDLRRLPSAGEMPEVVFEIQLAAHRGADLVQQILTFSRRAHQRRTPIKMAIALRDTLGLLQKTCPANVDLRSVIHSNPTVTADMTQMQQVLTNLGTNAIQAVGTTTGTVSFDLDTVQIDAVFAEAVNHLRPGPYAYVRVVDNGEGMDAHTLEHIFEPFFTTKGAGKGTGLGMAVVHGIVLAHEGAIRVQSTERNGTTVELWLPLCLDKTEEISSAKPEVHRGKGEHVFIVDDEEGLARIFGRLLRSLGYQVTVQTNSADAVKLFEQNPWIYQIALVDLHMPSPGGLDVAERLHALRPDLPIFIMSGYSEALGDTSPATLGVAGILQKPITRETLAAELRNALEPSATR